MEDKLKNKFADYSSEPVGLPAGHEARMMARLQILPAEKKTKRISVYIRYAAASILIVCGLLFYLKDSPEELVETPKTLENVDERLALLENRFETTLRPKIQNIRAEEHGLERTMAVLDELENQYETLKDLLIELNGNSAIAEAIRKNYEFRLRVMDSLAKQIELNRKNNTDDTIKI